MTSRTKIILGIGGLVIAVVILVFVLPMIKNMQNSDQNQNGLGSNSGNTQNGNGEFVPGKPSSSFNSFLPDSQNSPVANYLEPLAPFNAFSNQAAQNSGPSNTNINPIPKATPSTQFSNISQLKDFIIGQNNFIKPSPSEILQLPVITKEDMKINPKGINNLGDFSVYIALNSKRANFTYSRFNDVLKDKDGLTMMPIALVQKALDDNNFQGIKTSIPILKDFILAKSEFFKSTDITDALFDINKNVLAFDKLTLDLLDKADETANGKITRKDFEDFFKKYKNTASFQNFEISNKQQGLTFKSNNKTGFINLLEVFGLVKIAHAFGLPMGGLIFGPIPCTCDPTGFGVYIGPPVPASGGLYVSYFQTASTPLVGISPGAWILGNYIPGGFPCMQYAGVACVPAPIFAGVPTSGFVATAYGL